MTFDVADRADAAFDAQARLFSNDLKALAQPASLTGVKNGCAVTAQASPNMTVAVASGVVYFLYAEVAVAAGNVTITTANATQPRIDIVVVNSSGVKSVVAGSAAEFPIEPQTPASSVMLAQVYVPALDTAIGATQLRDRRIILQVPAVIGASTIVRKTANETVTSSAVLQNDNHLFFAMASNSVYQVKLFLQASNASSPGTMKINFVLPAGAAFPWLTAAGATNAPGGADATFSIQTTATLTTFEGMATTAATSGNFQLVWAQNASSVNATTMLANSYLQYQVVP